VTVALVAAIVAYAQFGPDGGRGGTAGALWGFVVPYLLLLALAAVPAWVSLNRIASRRGSHERS
jgi:hypothetical protein